MKPVTIIIGVVVTAAVLAAGGGYWAGKRAGHDAPAMVGNSTGSNAAKPSPTIL